MSFIKLLLISTLFSAYVLADTEAENCVSCHKQAVSDWQTSDHAKAMDTATAKSVLGNFSDVTATHHSQTAKFYKKGDNFHISFTEGGKTTDYQVTYTFGHYPLQQYLIETGDNKYQVFPFSWDSRPKEQGGQKWYPVYADEDIQAADRLHWKQPLQNWNGMCADCHSDGLQRKYTAETNHFDTKWDNINVGCQSCHGTMAEHTTAHKTAKTTNNALKLNAKEQKALGQWLHTPGKKVAQWQGEKRDNSFMDNCFACHSLRTPLTDGITPNKPFLDQFSPSFLSQPMYHVDGQIREEVYVYGSFLQSKMFDAGVNCLDCHNQHTMKLKVQGNGLCLQCHSAETYQQDKHLNHPADSAGGQCVSCHMPEKTYMGVDARRDHSFRIPRPELTQNYQAPNTCNTCHQDKSASWAKSQIKTLYGNNNPLSKNELALIQLQHQYTLPLDQHLAIINDKNLNEIYRASAIALLPNSAQELTDVQIKSWVNSSEPLIRLATAQIGFLLPLPERSKSYLALLKDQFKAVRVQAATHLLQLGIDHSNELKQAFEELTTSHKVSMWRGEGGLNMSMVQLNLQQLEPAIKSLQHSIKIDPYFPAAYINLADIYRRSQATNKEKSTYQQGISNNPLSGILHYSFGLHQIRAGEKQASLKSFQQAIKLEPENMQYAYVYFIALDNVGKTQQALAQLKMVIGKYPAPYQLAQLGMSFAQKLSDRSSYDFFQKYLPQ
ncbi:multiheme c-type cytochrome [Paraglaciecola sp. L3A3]|uniref:multiheme c-type cytochrome n=1 Tax=Paraglaciecola sp. L3A3 TaxID=2686358 RepID=UPI00131E4CB3|nr:multiheme c-type cytochrome [Paraglaciecola sp. L3A3]